MVTRLGTAFGVVAATTLLGDYYVQLAVIQPSLAAGEADGLSLVTQYNPHGLFIALEELGYILTSLSLVCMVPSLRRSIKLERAVRYVFVGGFALIQARSKEDAIEFTRRFLKVAGDGETEIRQLYEQPAK